MHGRVPRLCTTLLGAAAALALANLDAVAQTTGEAGKTSIWSGVYTSAQGERGAAIHSASCASCHGTRLNGAGQPDMPPSPAIAREAFLRKWAGRSLAELVVYVRTKMPPDAPGTLSDQEAVDAIAHMFAVSNLPAGEKELPPDSKALDGVIIDLKPK